MQYNGKKDTLEIFNDTWKVNHHGSLPSKRETNKNNMPFKTNNPNSNFRGPNNQNKPIGYNNINRKSGLNG